jgi:hypothetical protein
MWIGADKFWKIVESLAVSNERIKTLTGETAHHEATIEWMRTHINRLEMERALLMQTVYHAPLGSFEIERQPVNAAKPEGIVGVPAQDDTDDGRLGILTDHQALLEDMGDHEAGRQGIKLEADGTAVYTK